MKRKLKPLESLVRLFVRLTVRTFVRGNLLKISFTDLVSIFKDKSLTMVRIYLVNLTYYKTLCITFLKCLPGLSTYPLFIRVVELKTKVLRYFQLEGCKFRDENNTDSLPTNDSI